MKNSANFYALIFMLFERVETHEVKDSALFVIGL